MSAIRTPPRTGSVLRPVRTADERLSTRLHVRSLVVCAVLVAATVGMSVLLLTVGDRVIDLPTVIATILGDGRGGSTFIVNELRLPRLLVALLVGIALGVSGAILQGLTRNPLGSPDVVGLTVGAATGALVVILVIGGSMLPVAIGSVVGGLLASAVVYLLSYRRGVQSFRLILIGLGVGAALESVNSYLVVTAALDPARAAQVWLTGSLNNRGWEHVASMLVALVALLPAAFLLGRRIPMLDLGDDAAAALGLRVEWSRLSLVLVSVGLASVATAAAGPIAFVALAAPQVAARLTRSPGPGLVAAGLTGAVLLAASDFLAQRALVTVQLPVGVATGLIGGAYLIWLLLREFRRRSA